MEAPEFESKGRLLIPPVPELLTMKVQTPNGLPPICMSNKRSHRAEQFSCLINQITIYDFVKNLKL